MLSVVGCAPDTGTFMDPKGPVAAAQKAHLLELFWLTSIAVVPVILLVPILLWRYRYRTDASAYRPQWEYNRWLDVVMWGVPIAIIVILSFNLWQNVRDLDPYRPLDGEHAPVRIQVIGLDWKWLFVYPDHGIASMGQMAIPVDTPIRLDLTSDTVMQSFIVAELGGQIYTMPGMRTQLNFLASESGTFTGENMQYNGEGFATQKFAVEAMTPMDFDRWVSTARQSPKKLNEETYALLAKRATKAETAVAFGAPAGQITLIFGSVQPELFQTVIQRYLSGDAVPASRQPGAPKQVAPSSMKRDASGSVP